jgi:hypothetical protein
MKKDFIVSKKPHRTAVSMYSLDLPILMSPSHQEELEVLSVKVVKQYHLPPQKI